MKNNQINEEIIRNILLMKYDSKKTLSENRQIMGESSVGTNVTLGALGGAACWIGAAAAGLATFGTGALIGAAACTALSATLSDFAGTALRSDDIVTQTNAAIEAGKKLVLDFKGTASKGFDAKVSAKQFHDAVENNTGVGAYLLGAGTDEELLATSLSNCKTVIDLYLLDIQYRKYNSNGIAYELNDELDQTEQVMFKDMIELLIDNAQTVQTELEKKMKDAGENTENTGDGTTPTPGSDEELGCLKGISGYRYDKDRGEVILPSSDDGGYCIAYKNKGTQNFSSGKLVCFNADGQEHSTANYACENGVFTARNNKLKESRYFGGRRRITEIKVGGVDMNSSFSEKSGKSSSPSPGSSGGSTTPHRGSSGGSGGSSMTQAPSCDEVKSGSKEIKRGMKDGCVSTIQEKLKTNFPEVGSADGKFGGKTENAVKNFQSKNGLSSTGIVNKETYEKLFFEEKPKTIQDYVPGGSNTGGSLDLSTGV